jgi:hypothetical protein
MSMDKHAESSVHLPVAHRARIPAGYAETAPTAPPQTRLPWATVENWLVGARTYWVTTTRPDGRAHAVPLWGIWRDGALYFSTGAGTATAGNLAVNQAAIAHPGNGDQVAIIEGVADRVTDHGVLDDFAADYLTKYHWTVDPAAPPGPIYRLTATRVISWDADDSLVETMTRWEF